MVADEARFDEVLRRLRVRYAALPTSQLELYASHYPGHRLPRALVPEHVDSANDVTIFGVRNSARP